VRTANMPPGLKRYWQTHSRSGGHKKKSRGSSSTAMVRYSPAPAVKYKTRTVVIHKKRKGGGHKSARHMGGFATREGFNLEDLRPAGISALIGYSESGKGFDALQTVLDKLPKMGKAPREALAGLLAYYFRDKSDWIADAAVAFLNIGGYKIGQAGFSISGDDDE
jgi:hypothetical protein